LGRFFFMIFEVTILGCGAAAPTSKHNPSAQVVNVHDKLFLVDCGEGTQMQLRKFKVRFQRINHVFISHLHGDHYLGLMGFISSMHLLGRQTKLTIYGPPDLKALIDLNLKASKTYLVYELEFHATSDDDKHLIYEDKTLMVYSIPLKHRIECTGFIFEEKPRQPKVLKDKIAEYKLEPSQILELKKGREVTLANGDILSPKDASTKAPVQRSYAYCSDTASYEKLLPMIHGTSLLYHESTFLESEKERAKETFHSTAKQAASVALNANCKSLLLGHFSPRYSSDEEFKTEAKEIFPNVMLADEGAVFMVSAE